MTQGAKNQIFEWDADSAKVIAELTKVAQEIRKLRKEAVDLNKTQIEGKQVDHARVQENLKDLASKLNAQEKLRVSLRQMRGDVENVNQAQRTYNAQTLVAAYAIDDFITVASLQDWSLKGMAAGISAAANNISVLLAMTNPWLAIVPAVVAGGVKIGASYFSMGKEAEEAGKKMEDALEIGKRIIAEGANVGLAADQIAENKRQEEERKAIDALRAKQREGILAREAALQEPKEFFPKGVWLGAEGAVGPVVSVPNAGRDKRIADASATVRDTERQIQEIIATGEKQKQEFERKRLESQRRAAEQMLSDRRGDILEVITRMNGGVDPTKAVDSFLGGLGISQEVIPGLRDDLIRDARNKPKPPNMEARLKLQANEQLRLDLQTQEAFEEAQRGGRPLPRSRRKEFQQQTEKLNLEAAILRHLARQEELDERTLKENEKANVNFETLIKEIREGKVMPGLGGNR